MPRKMTASDRSSMIRLASTLPKGTERRAILEAIQEFFGRDVDTLMRRLEKEYPRLEKHHADALWKEARLPRDWTFFWEPTARTGAFFRATFKLGEKGDSRTEKVPVYKMYGIQLSFTPLRGEVREDRDEHYSLGGSVSCESFELDRRGSTVDPVSGKLYSKDLPVVVSADQRGRWEASREASSWVREALGKCAKEVAKSVEKDSREYNYRFPAFTK